MMNSSIIAALALLAQSFSAPENAGSALNDPGTVVGDEIVVRANIPRCEPLADDPLDAITSAAPTDDWYYVVADEEGSYDYLAAENHDPPQSHLTELWDWRRAGRGLPFFTFRQPADGTPICIGKRPNTPVGRVQLQHQLDSEDYACETVRLTMFAAARDAKAFIWMNGGGDPVLFPFDGDHQWTPVRIEWSPVDPRRKFLQFGVGLSRGDIWIYDVNLEVLPQGDLSEDRVKKRRSCILQAERARQREIWAPGAAARDRKNGRN